MYQPLAELLRPQKMSDIIGQDHLLALNMPLANVDKPQSCILWGPPGVGKTTLANILIQQWDCYAIKLSAVFSGIKEIREALDQAVRNSTGLFDKPTVLFIDEIHRFNKVQQDAFLHHLEEGKIILIGATTENPSFELNSALLSRLQVYVLKALDNHALDKLLTNALTKLDQKLEFNSQARELLIDLADSDARKLFNLLELVASSGVTSLDVNKLKQILPSNLRRFDKGAEEFYNQISALHKSVRGSDPDAALYWLVRMLDGGADPLYLGRRILRMAWEDIGLADREVVNMVNNALQTYERLGSPEGELALAAAVVYLAVTSKSNSVYVAYNQARAFVAQDKSREVPLHLRNAPTKLMQEHGYGKEYHYAHDYKDNYVPNENYWPDQLSAQKFYTPSNQGLESKIIDKLAFLRGLDAAAKNNNTE